MLIHFERTGVSGLEAGEVRKGDATVLPHCSFLRNSLPNLSSIL